MTGWQRSIEHKIILSVHCVLILMIVLLLYLYKIMDLVDQVLGSPAAWTILKHISLFNQLQFYVLYALFIPKFQ